MWHSFASFRFLFPLLRWILRDSLFFTARGAYRFTCSGKIHRVTHLGAAQTKLAFPRFSGHSSNYKFGKLRRIHGFSRDRLFEHESNEMPPAFKH